MTYYLNEDYRRKHRANTAKSMRAMVRHCPSCERGQYPARFDIGDGTRGYICHYCKHEWASERDCSPNGARREAARPEGQKPGPKGSPKGYLDT